MMGELTQKALEKGKRVAIFLPRRSLVNQLSESFIGWCINHGIVMSGVRPFTQPPVQIISIDTYTSRTEAKRMLAIDADIAIIDEAHLQFTPKKLGVFSRYKTVVGFTATPVAPKKQSLGEFYSDIVETITMEELIAQGYLSPLKFYAKPGIDLSGLKTDANGDYRESMLGEIMDKPQLVGDIFENWRRIADGKPTVIFASSQAHARHLTDEFYSHGYRFEYVDCTFSDDDRKAIFDRVRTGESLGIINVGIVSVGIDIPNLEVCVLARPTKLISVYLQCVGRITRLSEGKQFGIVIDHAGIIEKIGLATEPFEWSLEGKETVEERLQKKKEETKEPKQIICKECGNVFSGRKTCPKCGYESVPKGEPIPVHAAELTEIKKVTSEEKEQTYQEMLGWCRRHAKRDGLAYHAYIKKYGIGPAWKKIAIEPSDETSNYMKSRLIAFAKSRKQPI
jgi:superfamily II DNA or RNA helicase